jgi:hypothetical protein
MTSRTGSRRAELTLCWPEDGEALRAELRRLCGVVHDFTTTVNRAGERDVVAHVERQPARRHIRRLEAVFGLRRLDVSPPIAPGAPGLRTGALVLVMVLAVLGLKCLDLPRLSGMVVPISEHLHLTKTMNTTLVMLVGLAFVGEALGLMWWYGWAGRNRDRLPPDAAVMASLFVAAVASGAMTLVFWIPPRYNVAALVLLGVLVLVQGAGVSVTQLVRATIMKLSLDRARDNLRVETAVVRIGVPLAFLVATPGELGGWFIAGMLVPTALIVGTILAYPFLRPVPPADLDAEEHPTLGAIMRRSGTLIGGASAAFVLMSLTYGFAVVAIGGPEAEAGGRSPVMPPITLGPLHVPGFVADGFVVTIALALFQWVATQAMRIWGRHIAAGARKLIVVGGLMIVIGTLVTWMVGQAPLGLRIAAVAAGVIAAEVGLNPLNAGAQTMLSDRPFPVASTVVYYVVRGVTMGAIPLALALLPLPLAGTLIAVMLAAGIGMIVHVLRDRAVSWTPLFGAYGPPTPVDLIVVRQWDHPEYELAVAYRLNGRWWAFGDANYGTVDRLFAGFSAVATIAFGHALPGTTWGRPLCDAYGTQVATLRGRGVALTTGTSRPSSELDAGARQALILAGVDLTRVDAFVPYEVDLGVLAHRDMAVEHRRSRVTDPPTGVVEGPHAAPLARIVKAA